VTLLYFFTFFAAAWVGALAMQYPERFERVVTRLFARD
jgi:hypothetical protein